MDGIFQMYEEVLDTPDALKVQTTVLQKPLGMLPAQTFSVFTSCRHISSLGTSSSVHQATWLVNALPCPNRSGIRPRHSGKTLHTTGQRRNPSDAPVILFCRRSCIQPSPGNLHISGLHWPIPTVHRHVCHLDANCLMSRTTSGTTRAGFARLRPSSTFRNAVLSTAAAGSHASLRQPSSPLEIKYRTHPAAPFLTTLIVSVRPSSLRRMSPRNRAPLGSRSNQHAPSRTRRLCEDGLPSLLHADFSASYASLRLQASITLLKSNARLKNGRDDKHGSLKSARTTIVTSLSPFCNWPFRLAICRSFHSLAWAEVKQPELGRRQM